ncbi:MAG: sigma-70 family RNA polymerase sigma factor [Nocardioidaceae bacterium]|nr:sigma-70 family RNA polymerase sigma factor [Nocardioidaceae bacterium]
MSTTYDVQWQADRFSEQRGRLRGVAYRMLGSLADAEDAVQETWIRFGRTDPATIENLGGWLTTAVSRVSLNMLRTRGRRAETGLDGYVPDPVVHLDDVHDPEQEALLADAVGLALMVVLDALSPAERVAYVLHDLFDVPFEEIATLLDRNEPATRKLASRARQRVREASVEPDRDLAEQRAVVDAFFGAARRGDLESLVGTLDPDVVLRADRGAGQRLLLRGARTVASQATMYADPTSVLRPVVVNGGAGVLVLRDEVPVSLMAFTVVGGKVVRIDAIGDAERLARIL